jgi:DNA gyrase subunit A
LRTAENERVVSAARLTDIADSGDDVEDGDENSETPDSMAGGEDA